MGREAVDLSWRNTNVHRGRIRTHYGPQLSSHSWVITQPLMPQLYFRPSSKLCDQIVKQGATLRPNADAAGRVDVAIFADLDMVGP